MEQKPPSKPNRSGEQRDRAGGVNGQHQSVQLGDESVSQSHNFVETVEHELHDELIELENVARRVRRWPFTLAVLFVGALIAALSENLTVGPRWSVLFVAAALLVVLYATAAQESEVWTRRIALLITAFMTLALMTSTVFLIGALFHNTAQSAVTLFRNAILLWSANILVFSVWYWEVDQGGPARRHHHRPEGSDFLFPQNTMQTRSAKNWQPTFVDYLFLAFNTSTAFSPTDTLVLSKRAKVLMMTQASISLAVVAVLAARAINIA